MPTSFLPISWNYFLNSEIRTAFSIENSIQFWIRKVMINRSIFFSWSINFCFSDSSSYLLVGLLIFFPFINLTIKKNVWNKSI